MSRTSVAPATEVTKSADDTPPLTFEAVARALSHLSDLVSDLAEPSDRGLTDDLRIQAGTLLHISDSLRELSERCDARHEETEG